MRLTFASDLKQPGAADAWSDSGYWKYRIDGIAGVAHIPCHWLPKSPPLKLSLDDSA